MSVFSNLKDLAGTQYHHLNHTGDMMDISYLRRAAEEGFRLPSAGDTEMDKFWGGWVATPVSGVHHNVPYLDLASLYPYMMVTLNISPETLLGTKEEMESTKFEVHDIDGEQWVSPLNVRKEEFLSWDWTADTVEDSQISEDECVHGYVDTRDVKWVDGDEGEVWQDHCDPSQYKMVCDSSSQTKKKWEAPNGPEYTKCYYIDPQYKKGFVTETVEEWIEEKYRYTGGLYTAIKQIVNGNFGFFGDTNSRLFDWQIAESITLSSRKVWHYTASTAVEKMDEKIDGETFVKVGDTDGFGLCWEDAPSYETYMSKLQPIVEYINEEGYDQFCKEEFDVDSHWMEVEVESFADSLFVPAANPMADDDIGVKKRYAQLFSHDEADDEEVADEYGMEEVDEIAITGLEAKRSDVSPLTTEAQTHVLEQLLRNGVEDARDEVASYLSQKRENVLEGDVEVEYVAKRSGIGKDIESYGTANRRPSTAYRGAKFADKEISGETIKQGSKVKIVHVEDGRTGALLPSTYDSETAEDGDAVDVISVEELNNLPNGVRVNWDTHYQKSLKEPLSPIIRTVGWSWEEMKDGVAQQSLTAF